MKYITLWFAALLLLCAVIFWHYHQSADTAAKPGGMRGGAGDGRPLPVQAATATSGDIDVFIDALGTVTAFNTVTVKARVDGQLGRVPFREGQLIKQGGLLAEIDPRSIRPFE